MMNGRIPVMAIAASPTHWYSWVSHHLILDDLRLHWKHENNLKDLIPMEANKDGLNNKQVNNKEKVIVGHNIGFDRSYIREQYDIEVNKYFVVDWKCIYMPYIFQ